MRVLILPLLIAAVVVSCAPAVSAADNGFYLGASLGQAFVDLGEVGDIRFDEKDTAFKLFAGYRFLNFLAVEGGYVDLGAPTDEDACCGASPTYRADIDGFDLFAVGLLPMGVADVFVKVGMVSWNLDLSTSPGDLSDAVSSDGVDPVFGLGLQFRIRSFAVRGEVEYFDISDAKDVYLFSVGGSFTF